MRNIWRVLVFDVLAPLATIAALLMIGLELDWPLWWVPVCSILVVLIVEGMVANFVLARRDRVTVGTDDNGPGQRLAVVALSAAALVTAVLIGFTRWTVQDHGYEVDVDEVVRLATSVSEATATFSPQDPTSSIDHAATLMGPKQAETYKTAFAKSASELAAENITSQADAVSVGVEAMSKEAASVAVIMRATHSKPGSPPQPAVVAMRVTLTEQDGDWHVFDVTPINPAPVATSGGES